MEITYQPVLDKRYSKVAKKVSRDISSILASLIYFLR